MIKKCAYSIDENKLSKIKILVLMIFGKHDNLFPAKYAKKLNKKIKNSRLILIDGNHDWFIACPEKIMKYV